MSLATPRTGQARTRIKICGLREAEHVDAAVASGADAIGFVLYPPSPRAITLAACALLSRRVPAFVSTVALFVDPTREAVETALATARIDLLQFHGREPAEFCASFGRPYLKAFAVAEGFDLLQSAQQYASASALLLERGAGMMKGVGRHLGTIKIVSGLLMIAVGIMLFTGYFARLAVLFDWGF